jgi:hypothetical protein|tara:strand:+ start:2090 stop:3331 length:1242 start_codon:yes stop_codon:yes gene_type:complete
MSLVTETNQQYYQGTQIFVATTGQKDFTTTFDTDLIFGSNDNTSIKYALNNFKIYTSQTGLPGSFSEDFADFTVTNNIISFVNAPFDNVPSTPYVVVQLKTLDGGKYGNTQAEKAYGNTVEENYGSYQYVKLSDIVNNYMVGYVGDGKIIQSAKKSDVVFFAKRSLQEFSYDTLKSIKSQELTIPSSLSLPIPQDYVNYVSFCYIDSLGVKRPLYPNNNLTTNPYYNLLQDSDGVPMQDNFGENIEGTSITEKRWREADDRIINNQAFDQLYDNFAYGLYAEGWYGSGPWNWGRLYGLDPQTSQVNGWFGINERDGMFTFSSNLRDKLIVVDYISDGLAYDLDTRIPKLAEEAMYMSISYNLLAGRANVSENIVARFKKDRRAALRNAKIRLSNIKLDEIVQVMRGKSKWIKH